MLLTAEISTEAGTSLSHSGNRAGQHRHNPWAVWESRSRLIALPLMRSGRVLRTQKCRNLDTLRSRNLDTVETQEWGLTTPEHGERCCDAMDLETSGPCEMVHQPGFHHRLGLEPLRGGVDVVWTSAVALGRGKRAQTCRTVPRMPRLPHF